MLTKVKNAILEHGLVPPGSRILAAVSGGVDSVVMLDLLHRLSAEIGFELVVGHVNHNMRGVEAHLDAESVRRAAQRLKLEFRLGEIPASEWQQGGNRQERARELRFELLRGMARELSAGFIATAHNADDQAETFIDRLLRGSGPHGLSGIARRNGDLVRPLLDCTRDEIVEYARGRAIEWREDRSNADRKYRRSRIRHEIIPALRLLSPQVTRLICNASQAIRSQSEAVDQWAEKECLARRRIISGAACALDVRGLEFLPEAVSIAVFQRFLADFIPGLRGVGRAQLFAMQKMLSDRRPSMNVRLPGALLLVRNGNEFMIAEKAPQTLAEFEIDINGEGLYALPGGSIEIHISEQSENLLEGAQSAVFDLDKLSGGLRLRNVRQGDQIELPNLGHRKVSKVIGDRRVAAEKSSETAILEDGENILWVVGIRRSAHAYVDEKTKRYLCVAYRSHASDNG